MDALDRLEPVARPLLRQVDTALATLGAPTEHPVWNQLRRLGATPADAVAYVADLQPVRLRDTATRLRERAGDQDATHVPARLPWHGSAGELYAVQAGALESHLGVMAGRTRATASYVDAVADWQQRARDEVARTLADVLTSTQAVTLRSHPALGHGLAEAMREVGDGGATLGRAVLAAADIGAAVLGSVEDALATGRDLPGTWAAELAEVAYRAPVYAGPLGNDGTLRIQH